MRTPGLRHVGALGALALGVVGASEAHAYEYAARTRTLTQVYQLRGYRLVGDDVWVPRRRFAQSISLVIWDVGDLAKDRARARLPRSGPTVSMRRSTVSAERTPDSALRRHAAAELPSGTVSGARRGCRRWRAPRCRSW